MSAVEVPNPSERPKAERVTVGFDPGVKCSGFAVMNGPNVVAVGVIDTSNVRARGLRAVEFQARAVGNVFQTALQGEAGALLVVEGQQFYEDKSKKRKNRANPDTLIKLATVSGAALGAWQGDSRLVRPSQWKGQKSKGVHHNQILKGLGWDYVWLGKVKPVEEFTVPKGVAVMGEIHKKNAKEVLDAIGLAQWGYLHVA